MNCSTCANPGVESQANGNKFWYCRTCKVEIVPLRTQEVLDELYYKILTPTPYHSPAKSPTMVNLNIGDTVMFLYPDERRGLVFTIHSSHDPNFVWAVNGSQGVYAVNNPVSADDVVVIGGAGYP